MKDASNRGRNTRLIRLSVSDAVFDRLDSVAKRLGINRASIVRRAILESLPQIESGALKAELLLAGKSVPQKRQPGRADAGGDGFR